LILDFSEGEKTLGRCELPYRQRGLGGHAANIAKGTFMTLAVKTQTSPKCRKYNSPTWYRAESCRMISCMIRTEMLLRARRALELSHGHDPKLPLRRSDCILLAMFPIGPTQLSCQPFTGGADWRKRSIKRYSSGLDCDTPFLGFGRDELLQVLRRSPLRCNYGRAQFP